MSDERQNEIIIYRTDDGKSNISLFARDGSVWLNQSQMAELFATSKQTISYHIINILKEKELMEKSVVKEYLTTTEHERPSFLLGHFEEHFGRLSDLLLP